MTFFTEMRDLAREMIGPGSEFGEPFTVTREGGTYDPATRRRGTEADRVQTVYGSPRTNLVAVAEARNLVARFERVVTAVEADTGSFAPANGDLCKGQDGIVFAVAETAHVVQQGVVIVWIMGLRST